MYFMTLVPEQCKQHLRKIQAHECALRFVSKGVEQFKKNECQNAMNYYNEALQADNECVDALVARGCLFSTRLDLYLSHFIFISNS